jgi:KDO2-lipid IV(A) lauroyltransferase
MNPPKLVQLLARMSRSLAGSPLMLIASILGRIGYWLFRSERELAIRNIHACYPNDSSSAHQQIASRSFQHSVLSALDLLRFADEDRSRWPSMAVRNHERISAAVAKGRGVILITAHYGNLSALPFVLKGICADPAYLWHRPTRKVGWAVARFRDYRDLTVRPRTGFHRLESTIGGAMRAVHLLKRGNVVIMGADLTWGSGTVPVTFLGVPYKMSRVPASLSLRTRATLLPITTIRKRDGSYDVVVDEPIQNPTAISSRQAEQLMTEAFARILERRVRLCPEQWCWTHSDSWSISPPPPHPQRDLK